MNKGRMEAFSDGVLAILITIMVLELRIPSGSSLGALSPLLPTFLVYALSFLILGIYWNNHHHLVHAASHITGAVLWSNIHLLFWLSLVPFVTGWMGENHFAAVPTAAYGTVMLLAAIAYFILQSTIVGIEGKQSRLAKVLGKDVKGKTSLVLYAVSIPTALLQTWISDSIFVVVALIWLVPDSRIEHLFSTRE